MNDQIQKKRVDKKNSPDVKTQSTSNQHTLDDAILSPALLYHGGTLASQATLLTKAHPAQQQAMTKEIGQTQGNRHVQRLVMRMSKSVPAKTSHGPAIQTRLDVSQPDDPYEIEADRVADEVMRMPAPATPPPPDDDNGQDHTEPRSDTGFALRSTITPFVSRAGAGDTESQAPSGVEEQVSSFKGGGAPLPESEQNFFEPRFGLDLSRVRVHTGGTAIQTSRDLNARAYTVGSDIAFNAGEYRPGSAEGRRLMAHELTHVVQQTGPQALEAAPTSSTTLQSSKQIQRQDGGGNGPLDRIREALYPDPETMTGYDLLFMGEDAFVSPVLVNAWGELAAAGPAALIDTINQNFDLWSESVHRDNSVWTVLGENFATDVVFEFLGNNMDLFESTSGGVYDDIGVIKKLKRDFETDVYDTALHYLDLNDELLQQEYDAIFKSPGDQADDQVSPEHVSYLEELQQVARDVIAARQALVDMEDIPVGYRMTGDLCLDDNDDAYYRTEPVYFSPLERPEEIAGDMFMEPDDELAPDGAMDLPAWEEVYEIYELTKVIIDVLKNGYPGIYALDETDRLETFASESSPEVAQNIAGESLDIIRGKIESSRPEIGDGVKFRDLVPICQQLLGGTQIDTEPTQDWTQSFVHSVANKHMTSGDSVSFWVILGLGATLAAIVVMPLSAIAASALYVVATGADIYQAVQSWERYRDLSTAADANARDDLEVVADFTVDAAFTRAILDTVVVFVDIAMGAPEVFRMYRAIRGLGRAEMFRLIEAYGGADNLLAAVRSCNTVDEFIDAVRIVGVDEFINVVNRVGADNAITFVTRVGPETALKLSQKYGDDLVYFYNVVHGIEGQIDETIIAKLETAFDLYAGQGIDASIAASHICTMGVDEFISIVERVGPDNTVAFVTRVGPETALELSQKYGDNLRYFSAIILEVEGSVDATIISRIETAFEFYATQGMAADRAVSHVRGINMTQPVEVITLPEDTILYQWQVEGRPQGSYYAVDPDCLPTHLGISSMDYDPGRFHIFVREQRIYVVIDSVDVLKSTANAMDVNWGMAADMGIVIKTEGGAIQYFVVDHERIVPYTGGGS